VDDEVLSVALNARDADAGDPPSELPVPDVQSTPQVT
jgi:hypothetical protein